MFTDDGYSYREVQYQRSTPLDLHILVDGASANITAATCVARALGGSTSTSLTVVNASTGAAVTSLAPATETIKATFTTTNRTDLTLALYGEFELVWTVTFTMDSTDHTRDWSEILYVCDQIPMPAVNLSNWISKYGELGSSRSLPNGESNWWYIIRDGYREVRNYISGQTPDRRIGMIRNHQALAMPTEHAAWMSVCETQMQRVGGNGGDWMARYQTHKAEYERLLGITKPSYAEGSHTPGTSSPQSDHKTIQAPSSLNGYTSNWNMATGGFG